jgi:hypothetical protein
MISIHILLLVGNRCGCGQGPLEQHLDALPQMIAVLRVGQCELYKSPEIAAEIPDIEAAFMRPQPDPQSLAPRGENQLNRVRQLDLAAFARAGLGQHVENHGTEHVARRNRQIRRSLVHRRLLDQTVQLEDIPHRTTRLCDPVTKHLVARHLLERHDNIGLGRFKKTCHPGYNVGLGIQPDDRVSQGHHERLAADQWSGAQNGVSQSQLSPLARVEVLHVLTLEIQFAQFLLATTLSQIADQIAIGVEVVFDRMLSLACHEQQPADAGQGQFFDHVLSDRFATHRQHLFGLTLGSGQQTRPQSGNGNDSDIDHAFPLVRKRDSS